MVLLVCNVAEDIHVGIGVILELVLDRETCFCAESKFDRPYIDYFIPILLYI